MSERMCNVSVVPRSESPLSKHPHYSGGNQTGLAGGQGDHREAQGEKAVSHHLPTG